MVFTIGVIVVIIVVGVGILAFRFRTEKGIESGISSFRRELHALAPRPGERDAAPNRPQAEPRGVTIMSGESADAPAVDEAAETDTEDAAASPTEADESGDDVSDEPDEPDVPDVVATADGDTDEPPADEVPDGEVTDGEVPDGEVPDDEVTDDEVVTDEAEVAVPGPEAADEPDERTDERPDA